MTVGPGLRRIIACFSMECFMPYVSVIRGGTCVSTTANGTPSMCSSVDRQSKAIWDALLETLVDLGLTDDWQYVIDSAVVRAHVRRLAQKRVS